MTLLNIIKKTYAIVVFKNIIRVGFYPTFSSCPLHSLASCLYLIFIWYLSVQLLRSPPLALSALLRAQTAAATQLIHCSCSCWFSYSCLTVPLWGWACANFVYCLISCYWLAICVFLGLVSLGPSPFQIAHPPSEPPYSLYIRDTIVWTPFFPHSLFSFRSLLLNVNVYVCFLPPPSTTTTSSWSSSVG